MNELTYRSAYIYICDDFCGVLSETDFGYQFVYDDYYIEHGTKPVSLTMPITNIPYKSKILFPFFDGLLPEGWLLDIVVKNWKLSYKDKFGILLVACKDPVGNVSIRSEKL